MKHEIFNNWLNNSLCGKYIDCTEENTHVEYL